MSARLLALVVAAAIAAPRLAAAEPEQQVSRSVFAHDAGFRLGLGLIAGSNAETDQTITDAYYLAPELGYVFSFGTEPFLTAGLGVGGKEGSLFTFGAGLRQRFRFGTVEPFVQAGSYYVGDGEPLHMTPGIGAGLDIRLSPRASVGLSANRFFQRQTDQATLDGHLRASLTLRF